MKHMIFRSGTAALAAVVLVSSASSALATDFSGAYGGLSVGKAFGEGTATPTGSPTPYGTASTDTAIAGGVLGWNQRQGDFVYGLELGVSAGLSDGGLFTHASGSQMRLKYKGALELAARGGWVSGNTLFFGSLGAAHLRYEETFITAPPLPAGSLTLKNSDTVPFLGLGVEHGFADGWSLRGEYRHYFGVSTSNGSTPYPGIPVTLGSASRDYDLGVFALTLSYYF